MKKTSQLEAINTMLTALGQRPANSIAPPHGADVATALLILDEASREVQQRGWHFNTVVRTETPNSTTGKLLVPANALRVDCTDTRIDLVQVGDYLYDEKNDTFDLSSYTSLEIEYVFLRPWEDLPQPARTYIMLRATRKHAARIRGESELRSPSMDEVEARADLEESDGNTADYNILTNWAHYRVVGRNTRFPRG